MICIISWDNVLTDFTPTLSVSVCLSLLWLLEDAMLILHVFAKGRLAGVSLLWTLGALRTHVRFIHLVTSLS